MYRDCTSIPRDSPGIYRDSPGGAGAKPLQIYVHIYALRSLQVYPVISRAAPGPPTVRLQSPSCQCHRHHRVPAGVTSRLPDMELRRIRRPRAPRGPSRGESVPTTVSVRAGHPVSIPDSPGGTADVLEYVRRLDPSKVTAASFPWGPAAVTGCHRVRAGRTPVRPKARSLGIMMRDRVIVGDRGEPRDVTVSVQGGQAASRVPTPWMTRRAVAAVARDSPPVSGDSIRQLQTTEDRRAGRGITVAVQGGFGKWRNQPEKGNIDDDSALVAARGCQSGCHRHHRGREGGIREMAKMARKGQSGILTDGLAGCLATGGGHRYHRVRAGWREGDDRCQYVHLPTQSRGTPGQVRGYCPLPPGTGRGRRRTTAASGVRAGYHRGRAGGIRELAKMARKGQFCRFRLLVSGPGLPVSGTSVPPCVSGREGGNGENGAETAILPQDCPPSLPASDRRGTSAPPCPSRGERGNLPRDTD